MSCESQVAVLVVEDEAMIRLDLAAHLQERGYRVIEAASAHDAICILEQDRSIRVVFTDIRMPGDMDGVALAKYVRERWPPTLIVVCSGNSEEAFDIADIHILAKPYFMDQVTMVLNALGQQLNEGEARLGTSRGDTVLRQATEPELAKPGPVLDPATSTI